MAVQNCQSIDINSNIKKLIISLVGLSPFFTANIPIVLAKDMDSYSSFTVGLRGRQTVGYLFLYCIS